MVSTAVISSTRNTPGSVATTDTRGAFRMVSVMTRIPVESRNVQELRSMTTCGAEADARDCVLELGSARHVQLAFDAYHDAVVAPIDGNGEVRHIPHGSTSLGDHAR